MNWRYTMHTFLTDTMLEPLYWPRVPRPVKRRLERWHYRLVEKPVAWGFCRLTGHYATMDHCGMAKHDLCLWCGKAMPGQAQRGPR